MLYNANIAALTLGCLFKNPSLFTNPAYPLTKMDFAPIPMHRSLYVCAFNVAKTGCSDITEIEIDNFVSKYEAQKEILEDGNFAEFINTVKELSSLDNFEYYYNIVRKFSLLRELKEQGITIDDYYDETKDEVIAQQEFEKWSIQDILSNVESKTDKLKTKYDTRYVRDEMLAGSNTEDLLNEFSVAPSFGAFRSSPYLTQLFMGLNKGHLQMHSAPAGVAKTRMSIMDLCYLSSKYLWDVEANEFIENKNYCGAGLFIATEMNLRREINPIFLACISGVENNKITNGQLNKQERERVLQAGEILQDSKLFLTDMPDFTSKSIEHKIKEMTEQNGVENVVFDYLQLNSALAEEFKQRNGGVPSREDLVIRSLATDLKAYAEQYNVRMITSSQLNGNEKEMSFPDESCLSSAKSIKQKLDAGVIYLSAKERAKEMKIAEPLLNAKRRGFGEDRVPMPNIIGYVYKSRFGLYSDQKTKIFSYFDRSIMRITDFIVLDAYNIPIKIPRPVLAEGDF